MSNNYKRKGSPKGSKGQRGTTPLRQRRPQQNILSGDQVEGRQAVRELLITGTRKTREVFLAGDLDDAPILDDIIDLADEAKVPIKEIPRGRFESMADASTDYFKDDPSTNMREDIVDGHIIAIDLSEPMDRIVDKDEDLEYLDDYKLMNPYILKLASNVLPISHNFCVVLQWSLLMHFQDLINLILS